MENQLSTIILRQLRLDDLEAYAFWKKPVHRYHAYNGPYFEKKTIKELEEAKEQVRKLLTSPEISETDDRIPTIITNPYDDVLGEVTWYWKSKKSNWLEIGMVIFDENNWGKGVGLKAYPMWIDRVFEIHPQIIRIGLTTWSGNVGMIRLAEHLGLKKEAEYRKAHIVEGRYYDSVSYGILKDEWLARQSL